MRHWPTVVIFLQRYTWILDRFVSSYFSTVQYILNASSFPFLLLFLSCNSSFWLVISASISSSATDFRSQTNGAEVRRRTTRRLTLPNRGFNPPQGRSDGRRRSLKQQRFTAFWREIRAQQNRNKPMEKQGRHPPQKQSQRKLQTKENE